MARAKDGEAMSQLTVEELESTEGELLPERSEMALINFNLVIPVNVGLAANVLTINSSASAWAGQWVAVNQH